MNPQNDEQSIRALVKTWMAATKAGDSAAVMRLMADDVVFMVPGREPFGKEAFAGQSRGLAGVEIDGVSDIKEINVLGEWAWMRSRLRVTMKPPGGTAVVRSGYVLTILRKEADGRWVIYRDANLLAAEGAG
jgi:uncharacterized protein (TIGR02246 family)